MTRGGPGAGGGAGVHRVWTIGTSNRSIEALIDCLRAAGVRCVVDVRRFPTSQRHPQFSRDALAESVRAAGLEYVELGDGLGGYRTGGYARFRGTDSFRDGFDRLLAVAAASPTVLLCAERLPFRCHRLEIAHELERSGWEVVHLLDAESIWTLEGGVERGGGPAGAAHQLRLPIEDDEGRGGVGVEETDVAEAGKRGAQERRSRSREKASREGGSG